MKHLWILFLILVFACTEKASEEQKERPSPVEHVIVIGVDGMSPDGILNAPTPFLDLLMEEGAYTFSARAVLPTSSSSNWATMVTGVGPEQHGITSNGWERDEYILPPIIEGEEGIFPTVFSHIKNAKPDAYLIALYHWSGFGRLIEESVIDDSRHVDGEVETMIETVRAFESQKPTFTFIHLDHVDHAGHAHGHGSELYYESITLADSLIGEIVGAASVYGLLDNGIVIISSDHGGIGYGHGGETLEEIEIPFIIYGKGIKKGYQIPTTVYQYDNPATVLWALGIDIPQAVIGRPVKCAFEGQPNPDEEFAIKSYGPKPTFEPKANLYRPAGGRFEGSAEVHIKVTEEGSTIHYTLDGTEPDETSPVYEEPFTVSKTTIIKAIQISPGGRISRPAEAQYRIHEPGKEGIWTWQYFESPTRWSFIPTFKALKPISSGKAIEVDLALIPNREEDFGVVWEGIFSASKTGSYTFYTNSDDGSKLFVDDVEVVNNDGDHGTKERSGSIDLSKGEHAIKIEYFQGGGGYWIDAQVKGPGIPKQWIH